jgi:hypothetical protein
MGIADSFKQLAERAKARMAQAEDDVTADDEVTIGDKYDNAARDRFGLHGDQAREDLNERTDDFTGGERDMRRGRGTDRDVDWDVSDR